ncbi:MAG: hypothetical protein D6734_07120 [Candidatus Schekmanbacteria bacterium]|nr:MAG: hypothetical protein D6734_07120 [Candidatus Schekmanbacteria bacterium]
MKALTSAEMKSFLKSLTGEYDVRAPVRLEDGTRALGHLDEGRLAIEGGPIARKPNDIFFPQFDVILNAKGNKFKVADSLQKPLFVIGFTAEDCECLEFVDKFYSENFRDEIYFAKRDKAVIAAVSGKCGKDGEMLKIAGGKCDLEFIYDGSKYIVCAYTLKGKKIEEKIKCEEKSAKIDELKKLSDSIHNEDLEILKKAGELIRKNAVPDDFWKEIANRCISCTACNIACPTCTCFDVCDHDRERVIERIRMWDSCQLDGFMREASGHNPLGEEYLRARRRIHHKLAADYERWGHITCFLCGRCDDVCPTNIGIKSVNREIVKRFG